MNEAPNTGESRALFRIVALATALAFGAMVGSLFAVKSTPAGLLFELTIGSVLAFVIAAALAWFYWRLVFRLASANTAPSERRFSPGFAVFSGALLLIGIAAFLYPLKFVPAEKRFDVFAGLGLAFACILGVGAVMWKVKKFLDADQERAEREDRAG